MATRSSPDAKRFVLRAPQKKPKAYLVPNDESQTMVTPRKTPLITHRSVTHPSPPPTSRTNPSTKSATPLHPEAPPARRVVVVRSPNNPNVHRGPIDLGDFGQPNATDRQPALTNGHTSIYLIRRPIRPEPIEDPPMEDNDL